MNRPLVSIVIPVYNMEQFVLECVNSILDQTYTNIELMIIDDASTDSTYSLLKSLDDSRIVLIKNELNLGLAACVNAGIVRSNGKYIARMDGDDIAMPDRIQKQVSFLEQNTDVDIVGTAMKSFGHSTYLHVFPSTHAECKTQLLFNVCFGHPTVMMRKSIFKDASNFYNEELRQYSEEYELWTRLVDKFKFANLVEPLLKYRTFPESSKTDSENKRKLNSYEIRSRYITHQLGISSDFDFSQHDVISNLQKMEYAQLEQSKAWFQKLRSINLQKKAFDSLFLDKELSKRFFELMYWNSHYGFKSIKGWYTSTHWLKTFRPSVKQQFAFILRSLLRK